jgi:hypothetical protein
MGTRKFILGTIFLFVSLMSLGQNKFDLMPGNMIKFIGKVNQEQFEQSVGSPVGEEEGFIVYEVENTYDNEITAIRCFYRESDGKLISIKFGTKHYLAYWIDFTQLNGYPKTEKEAQRRGMFVTKKDRLGEIYQINLKLKTFGCQIMDIRTTPYYSTAIINYHTVKL